MIPQHYYTVGNRPFYDKLDAVSHADATKQEVVWQYHDSIYESFDWTKEPELSLDQLYAIRAREIREEFDYVVVLVSGGADSRNVAYSFLRNGIKIDEIVASVQLEGLGDMQLNNKDTRHVNTVSETTYTQLPLLNEIKREFPQQKITVHDYFHELTNFKTDIWLKRCGEWLHPTSAARYSFDRLTHIKKLAEAGKRVGFVYGIDKPHVQLSDKTKNAYIVFYDLAINVCRPPFEEQYIGVENVPFYWYDDPSIPCKQAHILLNSVVKPNHNIAKYFPRTSQKNELTSHEKRQRNSTYQRAITPFIYPSTYIDVFQADKPTDIFLGQHDQWLYDKHKGSRMIQMLESDTKNFVNGIKDELLNPQRNGFKTCVKHYTIGHINTII
jgi:hypothetical protein